MNSKPWLVGLLLAGFAVAALGRGATAFAAEEKAGGEGEAAGPPELPNLFEVVEKALPEDSRARHFLEKHFRNGMGPGQSGWENVFFSFVVVGLTWLVLAKGMARRLREPGRFQGAIEALGEGMLKFFGDVMGERNARDFVPLVGSLFFFILLNNLLGLVPLAKSSTSTWKTTFALSIPVFCIVQYVGVARCGLWGRLYHLMGSPKDIVGWVMSPLMFVLEVIGELVRPVSLGLRLFGNIMGEDILLGAFAGMGVMLLGALGLPKTPVGLPLQFPFLFLALLTSVVQALVFSLLAAIYILLALPHEEHGHEEHGAHEGHKEREGRDG
ncbi:MAG: F0F1 ATP synthase subunit A [Candidatus Sumerlaeota bacterium]|nr:F0F1 ATP synthase subunit A [Candidatus Sumerlaeota bacterium]